MKQVLTSCQTLAKFVLIVGTLVCSLSCTRHAPKEIFNLDTFVHDYVEGLHTLEKTQRNVDGTIVNLPTSLFQALFVQQAEAKSEAGKNSGKKKRKKRKRKKKKRTVSSAKKKGKKEKKETPILDLPKIKKVQLSQAKRLHKVEHYKHKGMIGETLNGTLMVRKAARIPASSSKAVYKVVEAENKDREKLYRLISEEREYEKDMQKILRENFFNNYRKWDPKGSYFYVDGHWYK